MRKLLVSFFLIVLLLFTCGVQDGFARGKKKGVKEVEKETPYQKLFKGKTCETVKGLLTIHKMDGKVYFEIPRSLLEKDMLLGSIWECGRETDRSFVCAVYPDGYGY